MIRLNIHRLRSLNTVVQLTVLFLLVGLFSLPVYALAHGVSTPTYQKKIITDTGYVIPTQQEVPLSTKNFRQEAPAQVILGRNLNVGSVGSDVEILQNLLATTLSIQEKDIVTGYFGPRTLAAVKEFQTAHGLEVVGTVGPLTRALLNKQLTLASAKTNQQFTVSTFVEPAKIGDKIDTLTNQILAQTKRYKENRTERAVLSGQLVKLMNERKKLVRKAIEENPEIVVAIKEGQINYLRENLPPAAAILLEKKFTRTGTLEMVHVDDFDHPERSKFNVYLKEKGKRYPLHFSKENTSVAPGATVTLKGIELDSVLVVENNEGSQNVSVIQPAPLPTVTQKKLAVLLVTFETNPLQPFTHAGFQQLLTQNATSVNAFYAENSYGKVSFKGSLNADADVFGWYTIPSSVFNPLVSCDLNALDSVAKKAAAADGFILSNYEVQGIVYPRIPGTTCFGGGYASVGGNPGWFSVSWPESNNMGILTLTHELGHTWGVLHSSSLACLGASGEPVALSDSCTRQEYGDVFDPMGGSYYMTHFNNIQKRYLGWLDQSNVVDIANEGTYTYTLAPIETKTTAPQLIRIHKSLPNGLQSFVLEYRRPNGFPKVHDGILVRAVGSESVVSPTYLLSGVNPPMNGLLTVGNTITDPASGVSITTVSTSTVGAQVRITVGPGVCVKRTPYISVSPNGVGSSLPLVPADFILTIRNNDSTPCGASAFNVTPYYPSRTAMSPTTASLTLLPSETITRTFRFTPPTTMSNGEILGFAFKVEKQGDEQYYAMVEAEYSFGYVPISSEPTASIVSPQNGSTVSGSVTTSVAASSAYPIQNILYYRNGLLSDMKFTAPYDSLWNTTKYPNGTYTLGVRAKDLIGARRYTPYTQVTVSNGGDTTPPVTSITSPTAGSQMPQIATVSVLANDASGVSKVELWKDSILYATDLTAPYTFTWDTTQEVNGTHTLMSKAYDIYGNVGISVGVSVLTQNVTTDSQPPITYISSPTQGVVVSGTTLVQSVASDNVGVTNIELYKNNALISSGAYSYAWNTVGEQNGTYTFQSKAYDAAGNQGISVPVSVTVNNQTTVNDSTPPTVSITNPAYNQVLPRRGSVSVSATAADQSGIATIRVFIDGVLKKTCSLTTTCQYSWSIGKVSSGTHTVSVTAIDNSPNMNSTSASISVIK